MAHLLQAEFKHNGVFVQASTEPRLNGAWRGLLVGPAEQQLVVNSIATALQFDVPFRFGASLWSTFAIANTEPGAVIDEVLDKMLPHFADFPIVPYELWFTVFNDAILTIKLVDENRWVAKVSQYNPVRGLNKAFVERAKALPEVNNAIGLYEGQTIIALTHEVSDAAAFVTLGQKLAEAYEQKGE